MLRLFHIRQLFSLSGSKVNELNHLVCRFLSGNGTEIFIFFVFNLLQPKGHKAKPACFVFVSHLMFYFCITSGCNGGKIWGVVVQLAAAATLPLNNKGY